MRMLNCGSESVLLRGIPYLSYIAVGGFSERLCAGRMFCVEPTTGRVNGIFAYPLEKKKTLALEQRSAVDRIAWRGGCSISSLDQSQFSMLRSLTLTSSCKEEQKVNAYGLHVTFFNFA